MNNWIYLLSDTQRRHARITRIGINIKTSVEDTPLLFLRILSSQTATRLLADYLEDYCDDDGYVLSLPGTSFHVVQAVDMSQKSEKTAPSKLTHLKYFPYSCFSTLASVLF